MNAKQQAPRIFDPERPPEPKYFTRVPDDVVEDPRLSSGDLRVFVALAKGHWFDDKKQTITQTELAKRCRMSIRGLRPHLVKLEGYGYLMRVRVPGRDTLITLTYQLRPDLVLAPDAPTQPVTSGSRGVGRKLPSARKKTSDASEENFRALGRKLPTPPLFAHKECARELEREEEKEERGRESRGRCVRSGPPRSSLDSPRAGSHRPRDVAVGLAMVISSWVTCSAPTLPRSSWRPSTGTGTRSALVCVRPCSE